jgi:small subunit ribosomal protein S8
MQNQTADMFTRIRNALAASKNNVLITKSKFNLALAKLMLQEGYILNVEEIDSDYKHFNIKLKYYQGNPVIEMLKTISLPSKRIYVKSKEVTPVYRGLGISIISTSSGLMTDREARFKNLGGEVICQIL